jgi:hypothetical protein
MGNNTSEQAKSMHQNAMGSMTDYAKSSVNKDNIAAGYNDWRQSVSEYFSTAFGQHPLTIESLTHSVTTMKTHHVEHMLHQGMNPNEPMDNQGHTILDAFMVAHSQNLTELSRMRLSAAEKTQIFLDIEERAFATLDVLREHGAKTSAGPRNRVPYVA